MKLTLLNTVFDIKLWLGAILLQAGFNDFFTKYIFADIEFLKWLFIAMAVDLATGIAKVWKNEGYKAITSKGLRDTVIKFIQYGGFLIITHIMTHFQVGGQQIGNWSWINKIAYEFIILVEVKSVYENIVAINPKLDFFSKVVKKIAEMLPKANDTKEKDGTSK